MPLSPGEKIGPYEVVALLGEGGMGQVYRARDTKLGRMVAIKVLPDAVVQDADRRARFLHEAKTLATLSHPNIAAVYGWEESGGAPTLVMELVDGRPLDKAIPRKGMPLEEALQVAIQVTRGLEAAHHAGIVHRDLKPANVIVTPSGAVKLLDFGLAKLAATPAAAPSSGEETVTVTALRTAEGAILGTVAYMSPEQAQGKPVDARSDLFSFGTVLFEMLTGRRPFGGDNQASTLAAILREDASAVSSLVPVPAELDRLVARCLRKDAERRFQTASDLRAALEDLAEAASTGQQKQSVASSQRRRSWWIAAGLGLAAIGGAAYWLRPTTAPTTRPMRQLTFESGMAIMPALSPDGKLLAYASDRAGEGGLDLWIRQTAAGDPHRLTSGMGTVSNPQFSPDGTRVLFLRDATIFDIPALGGEPRKLVDNAGPFTVSPRGEIAFVQPLTGAYQPVMIVPMEGGVPSRWPSECTVGAPPGWSTDGQRLAFLGNCGNDFGLYVAPRQGGAPRKIPLPGDAEALKTGVSRPHRVNWHRRDRGGGAEELILPVRNGDSVNLMRIGLDGAATPITQGTGWESAAAVSASSDIVFTRAEYLPTIWSMPVEGSATAAAPKKEASPAGMFGVSRDASKLLFGRMAGLTKGELVSRDLASGAESVIATHQLQMGGIGSFWTQVSPDGSQAVYRMVPERFKINQCLVPMTGGAARCLETGDHFTLASGWRPDGRRVLGECNQGAICEMDPADWSVRQIVPKPANTSLLYPSYSTDGKWLGFMQRSGGTTAIALARVRGDGSVAPPAEWMRVSPSEVKNAARPRFTDDGRFILYIKNEGGVQHLLRQPVDLAAGKPGGPAVETATIQSFPAWFADTIGSPTSTVEVSRGRVYFNTVELRGNVWTMSLQ
jgi:serine/threonine protein kinase/Tol biopolymer transport system component